MYPHPIRLHGPWELHQTGQPSRMLIMPAVVAATGAVQLRRRFGMPRRIDDFERVWLMAEALRGSSIWRLNGEVIANLDDGPAEIEITNRLHERNELSIEFPSATGDVGLAGDIALVIRCAAFLVSVHAWRSGDQVKVTGSVAGDGADPLEVYLIAGDRPCGYRKCRAGEPFELQADRAVDDAEIRVELVNVSTVWDNAIVTIA